MSRRKKAGKVEIDNHRFRLFWAPLDALPKSYRRIMSGWLHYM